MQQWECIVCGWIYDEKVGDPDSGIAPGTKFEDIPDDWMCPECGVGKDDFELIDVPDSKVSTAPAAGALASESLSDLTAKPIVIVGSGLAGYGLLKELRKLDQTTPIIVITKDDGRAYSKPALSTGYTKGTSASDLSQMDAGGMAAKYDASVWTFTEVTAIDTATQRLTLNHGAASCDYHKLVLATGAQCIQAPLGGNAVDKILSINDLLDFAKFQATVEQTSAKRICLIGAGLIGCEYANDLLNGGFEVDIVDPMQSCLPNLLPAPAGNAVKAGLSAAGAKFHLGKLATKVNEVNGVVSVKLDDDSEIEVDLVVSAIGVRPNTTLAEQAGLEVNRGIRTNTLLETSANNVYALGDNAEVNGYSLVYVAPLVAGSRALAQTLAGNSTEVTYPAMPIIVKTPACPVTVCPPPIDSEGKWVIVSQDGHNVVAEFENPQGETIGYALTGDAVSERARLTPLMPDLI